MTVGRSVDRGLVGARVVSSTGGAGGYAELASVPAADHLGSGWAGDERRGRSACGRADRCPAARSGRIRPGERVLVEAAAGGVGSLLVQLAKRAGATVIAAAGGARKLEFACALGADVAVDYRRPSWTSEVGAAISPAGVDVVFDGVAARSPARPSSCSRGAAVFQHLAWRRAARGDQRPRAHRPRCDACAPGCRRGRRAGTPQRASPLLGCRRSASTRGRPAGAAGERRRGPSRDRGSGHHRQDSAHAVRTQHPGALRSLASNSPRK